jgi:anti-anti-sigma regulatory factor
MATRSPARLDLVELDFIDSTGVQQLVRVIGDASIEHWQLQIEPNLALEVKHVLVVMHLQRIVDGANTTAL